MKHIDQTKKSLNFLSTLDADGEAAFQAFTQANFPAPAPASRVIEELYLEPTYKKNIEFFLNFYQ